MLIAVTAQTAKAQPQITFERHQQELGYVIWRKPATIVYEFTNTGDKPLVISNVTTSCGCTTAEWTRKAIQPKGKGQVSATFDAELIGQFWKEIGVYCNASNEPIYLSFNGEVTADSRDHSFTHPYSFGAIGLNKNKIDFGEVSKGDNPSMEILVANATGKEYDPILMHLPAYLTAEADPETLPKGKDGKITVTLHTDKVQDMGEIRSSVYLSRYPGDKVSSANEIPFSVMLLPDFNAVPSREKNYPPVISVPESIDFGQMMSTQKKTQQVLLTNLGQSNLTIYSVSVSGNSLGVKLGKRTIAPGETVKMKVTLTAKLINTAERQQQIVMITNDPKHPKVCININATLR